MQLQWLGMFLVPFLMASTCGSDGSGPSYVSPFCLEHPGMQCTSDDQCSDHVFCDGVEHCMPHAAGADGCGCLATSSPCSADQTCNEAGQRCDMCRDDVDGDGHISQACGGDDCDDNDPNRFPGNMEVCDAVNHDEDCDPMTFGERDADGDGWYDATCCNANPAGGMYCGNDCDDTNAAIFPGEQECTKSGSTNVIICQIDGTFSAPVACSAATTCITQPNGTGVCR